MSRHQNNSINSDDEILLIDSSTSISYDEEIENPFDVLAVLNLTSSSEVVDLYCNEVMSDIDDNTSNVSDAIRPFFQNILAVWCGLPQEGKAAD